MKPIWHLDSPKLIEDYSCAENYTIKGWIASLDKVDKIQLVDLDSNGIPIFEFSQHKRTDLKSALTFDGLYYIGFEGTCSFEKIKHLPFATVQFSTGGITYKIIAPVHRGGAHSIKNKPTKLKRLIPYFICPKCGFKELQAVLNKLECPSCEAIFPVNDHHINFLSEEYKQRFNIIPVENVSAHDYDSNIINLINKYKDGLILDCGAGLRNSYYENVVNYEVVAYESTDILGVGESLPFKDSTFDGVLSLAVLEHVKDPFQCASEIKRVLKPGGILYCQVPFLQPFHAYPNHYYNMTQSGILNLFEDQMDIEKLETMDTGQPLHTLNWILQTYSDGLTGALRKKFLRMKVKDFLVPQTICLNRFLNKPLVRNLSVETKRNLSCANYMIAKKKKLNNELMPTSK